MRATVKDVARLAQVSPKTVSNVVNGTSPVSQGIRTRVERAMAALDYVPNLSARALRNGRSGLIALALPDLSTAYSAELAHHFVVAAGQRRLSIQIEETAVSGERELQLLSRARAHLIDGLILSPVILQSVSVHPGLPLPPTVFIGEVDQSVGDHVWVDNVVAAAALTSHLTDLGHRRIAALGLQRTETARLRLRGYRRALRAAGIRRDPDLEVPLANWTRPAPPRRSRRTWKATTFRRPSCASPTQWRSGCSARCGRSGTACPRRFQWSVTTTCSTGSSRAHR